MITNHVLHIVGEQPMYFPHLLKLDDYVKANKVSGYAVTCSGYVMYFKAGKLVKQTRPTFKEED